MKLLTFLRDTRVENIIAGLVIFFSAVLVMANDDLFFEEEEEQVIAEVKPQPKPVDHKQLKCLATNIFYEAGSEPEKGKQAVARVVMNRVQHGFAPNPCSVIYQVSTKLIPIDTEDYLDNDPIMKKVKLCQFSWVCESDRKPLNINDPRYKQSERIAYNVLAHDAYKDVIPSTVLFFHNLWVNPMWPYKKVAQIGNHIFYEKTKKKQQKPQVLAKA
jgi:spore germination cell wall hydrolase CwlJ-like protein